MSDTPQVINTLQSKADELTGYIAKLERDLDHARKDLAHVRAAMVLFEAPRENGQPAYMNVNALFRRRELGALCKEALANGPLNTREIAAWVIASKGLDGSDRHLRTAVAYRVVQALRMQEKRRGPIQRVEKVSNVVVWSIRPRLHPSLAAYPEL
jgi:hypothetical protein